MKFINVFLVLWIIFVLLDPDQDYESGSRDPIESGSTGPQHCREQSLIIHERTWGGMRTQTGSMRPQRGSDQLTSRTIPSLKYTPQSATRTGDSINCVLKI
jgi:hypothetical protein